MGIQQGESGKLFGYNTKLNMSAATTLELKLIDPTGAVTSITAPRLSAPGVDGVFRQKGQEVTYLAFQYMQFTLEATDFPIPGIWVVCGVFTNAGVTPPQIIEGKRITFEVGKAC